jgi:hypothetical protein
MAVPARLLLAAEALLGWFLSNSFLAPDTACDVDMPRWLRREAATTAG